MDNMFHQADENKQDLFRRVRRVDVKISKDNKPWLDLTAS